MLMLASEGLRKFQDRIDIHDESGGVAIEYALLAALIALAIAAGAFALGEQISDFFESIGGWIGDVDLPAVPN